MADLAPQQWELGGVVWGLGTEIEVLDFDPGSPDLETGTVNSPLADGVVFGRDWTRGRTMTWELITARGYSAEAARQSWASLARVWDARNTRTRSRAVLPLRMRLPGGDTRVVYGRPRGLEPGDGRGLRAGHMHLTAEFECADAVSYADTERDVSLSLVTTGSGGITWPESGGITWPLVWSAAGERQDAVTNSGDVDTWPVVTIRGPVAQPSVSLVGTDVSLRLDTSIAGDRSVTIDPRPWARSVLRDDGSSLAGELRGSPLADLRIPPGRTIIHYGGTDLSGQSSASIRWRDAYVSP